VDGHGVGRRREAHGVVALVEAVWRPVREEVRRERRVTDLAEKSGVMRLRTSAGRARFSNVLALPVA